MYYRVAIRREGDHRDQAPLWKWYSTALGSFNSILFFFHYYRALPLDRLGVFSSSSREELKEQLMCENKGLGSNSVPAVQFLRELFTPVPEKTAEVSAHQTREQREPAIISNATNRLCNECSTGAHALVEKGMSVLERRRGETECGAGSDHDLPYSFTLPGSWPQVRAWMRLLARVHEANYSRRRPERKDFVVKNATTVAMWRRSLMNCVKTYEEYEQLPVSSERTFPAAPYPRTFIHCVLDNLYDAVQAVHALRSMDFDPGDIHVMASWDFVEAMERRQQRQNRLAKMLIRIFTFLDEGFGDVYLHEALREHHILAVRLSRNEQILQVHDALASHHARLIKYVDIWTVADLPPSLSKS